MAAPIRIRISQVLFDNNDITHMLDPFWILISDNKYPTISDVKKKILSICEDAILSTRKCSQTNNKNKKDSKSECGGSSSSSSGADSEISQLTRKWRFDLATCQLWLDGCRLLDLEQTALLRENDSLTVKYVDSKSRAGFVHSEMSPGLSLKSKKSSQDNQNHSIKKRKHKVVSDLEEEVNEDKSHHKKKKKKRKKEKECDYDIEDQMKEASFDVGDQKHSVDATPGKNVNKSKDLSEQQENDKLEEMKKSMLCYLDEHSAKLNLSNGAKSSESEADCRNVKSPENTIVKAKKRRRRRKSKRAKRSEETPALVRGEDKPTTSSFLNLPWSQQPQNTRYTFESDEEEEIKTYVGAQDQLNRPNMWEQTDYIDNPTELQTRRLPHNCSNNSNNVDDTKQTDSTGPCAVPEEVVGDKSQGSTALSKKTRKYVMRSTMGILDNLRSGSSSDHNKSSNPCNGPASTNSSHTHNKVVSSATPHTFAGKSMSPSVTTTSCCNPIVTPNWSLVVSDTESLDKSSSLSNDLLDAGPLQVQSGTKTSLTNTAPLQSPNRHKDIPNSPSLSVSNLLKVGKSSRQDSVTVNNDSIIGMGSYVDLGTKFNDLLQRRKFSNGKCTVSTSQNGVTVCSRQKSPRVKNAFADPAIDVLTNKSTIVKYDSNRGKCQQSENLTNGESHVSFNKGDAVAMSVELKKDDSCGKVEVIPVDFEHCPLLLDDPQKGDVLAYKILEMSHDYTPIVSSFKSGKVSCFEEGTVHIEQFGERVSKRRAGKFEVVYDDEEEDTDNSMMERVALESMLETRLVKRECLK